MKSHFNLALNNLKRRKLRSWLTVIGIFIGIAAVVSLITLGAGLKEAITGQFGSLSSDKLTIQNAGSGFGPPGSTSVRKLTEHDIKIIESVDGVENVISRLIRIAKVEYNDAIAFNYLGSMPENKNQLKIIYESFNPKPASGRLLEENDLGKVVLGSDMARKELFGKKIEIGKKIIIQGKEFEVVGILKPSSSFQLNFVILMMESDMKNLLNIGEESDLIVAQIKPGYDIEKVAETIKEKLRKDRKEKIGEEDFSVQTPLQALSAINTILTVINIIVIGIACISLIVGGIGIANSMYTSVLEREKEIGTMKAIGARNSDILKIFLIESGLLGMAGGIIGIIIGLGFAFVSSSIANLAFGQTILAFRLNYVLVLGSLGFSFLLGIIFGLLPARQASKLNPVDALRS
jgi:putative ABC transport system permease protein